MSGTSEHTNFADEDDTITRVDHAELVNTHESIVEGLNAEDFGRQTLMELLAAEENKTVSQKLTEFLLQKLCTDDTCANAKTFEPGTLITEGERRNSCYLVLPDHRGIVIRKTVHHPDHGDIVMDIRTQEGSTVLGEIALFGTGRATASAELKGPTRAIEITTEELFRILEENPELEKDLRKIAAGRVAETIETVSRAEDEFRRASSETTRQRMRSIFSFKNAHEKAMKQDAAVVLGTFQLEGTDNEGNTLKQEFTVTAQKTEQFIPVFIPTQQRTTLGYIVPFLPKRLTHSTKMRQEKRISIKSGSVTITVVATDKPGNPITTIEFSTGGKNAYIAGTFSEKLGLGGMRFISQIYREALSAVEEIDTTFHEEQTVEYAYEHDDSETLMAPSAWGAHSSVIAARKGFVTVPELVMRDSVWAKSHRIEPELDNIVTVLRHIERVCIPEHETAYQKARMTEEQFSKLYDNIEIKHALQWAEQSLEEYLENNRTTLQPDVQKVMDMQTKRIAELWGQIPQSSSVMEI